MMQTHFTMNNLEGPLTGRSIDAVSEKNIFQDIGIDAAVMYSTMNSLTDSILESCCITFPDTSLLLLPGTEISNYETYERDISSNIYQMIQAAENHVDIVMIDTSNGHDELSFKLMSSADVIIINLTQRRYVLNKLFREYEEIFANKKAFFLFGNYDKNSGCNIINCRIKYGRYINKDNSGVVPYCSKIIDAQNKSNIVSMVKEGLRSSKRPSSGEVNYFFKQACLTTTKIMNMLSVEDNKTVVEGRSE